MSGHVHSSAIDQFIMECDHCWGENDCISTTHRGSEDTNACCICGDPRVKKRTRCRACDGSGVDGRSYDPGDKYTPPFADPCWHCDGTGHQPTEDTS